MINLCHKKNIRTLYFLFLKWHPLMMVILLIMKLYVKEILILALESYKTGINFNFQYYWIFTNFCLLYNLFYFRTHDPIFSFKINMEGQYTLALINCYQHKHRIVFVSCEVFIISSLLSSSFLFRLSVIYFPYSYFSQLIAYNEVGCWTI